MKNFYTLSDSKGLASATPGGSLSGLSTGDTATIETIDNACTGLVRRRLLDLGFVPGTQVTKLGEGFFRGPSRFKIRNNIIALRPEQASFVLTRN
jgi:Fe2+ transport system protein FeoA